MRNSSIWAAAVIIILAAPLGIVSAATASIQSLSPGPTVVAKHKLSFSIAVNGFSAQQYQLADSFVGSTAVTGNIDGGGNFSWVPVASDVGTHTFTITARDFNENVTTVTQTVTVLPPPSISITNVSPTGNIYSGNKLTFTISQTGFINPKYVVGDDFSGSTVGSTVVDSSGYFSWTPDLSQNGTHRITVYATDSSGNSASANLDVQVGLGPRLTIQLTSTSSTVLPGQYVSFFVAPSDFNPTGYSLADEFSGKSTITNSNISASGAFWWTPSVSDVGIHKIKVFGQVGAFGDKASSTLVVTVLGTNGVLPQTNQPVATTTNPSLLSTLQAQLAELQAKMTSQGSSAQSQTGFTFSQYLKPGSEGDEVLELQKILIKEALLTVAANGYYGPATTNAVIKFQQKHGLAQLGVVGPATRSALNGLVRSASPISSAPATVAASSGAFTFQHFMGYGDDTLPDVLELQKKLKTAGYLSYEPTGFYGSATEKAVKKFQSAKGLPAVGYCDTATRAALNAM